jgi:hypothetical protein
MLIKSDRLKVRSYGCVSARLVADPYGKHQTRPLEDKATSETSREGTVSKGISYKIMMRLDLVV